MVLKILHGPTGNGGSIPRLNVSLDSSEMAFMTGTGDSVLERSGGGGPWAWLRTV